MKNILLFILLICSFCSKSQIYDWAKQSGGILNDEGKDIATDNNGNVISIGVFSGVVDFDPGPGISTFTSNGNSDIYITKYDMFGNFIWAKQIGGTGSDIGKALTTDNLGNIYSTGVFEAIIDLDPGIAIKSFTSLGLSDAFVIKLDSSGNFIWGNRFGGTQTEESFDIILDSVKNVYSVGQFNTTVDFDPGTGIYNLTVSSMNNMYLSKLDSLGNFIYAKKVGGGTVNGKNIHIDPSGNILISGEFAGGGLVDFDPGTGIYNLPSGGLSFGFILKLNSSGNFMWVKDFNGVGNAQCYSESITTDAFGNIYSTGYFFDNIDFDPGPLTYTYSTASGAIDIFISKLDKLGNFLWAKRIGGAGGNDQAYEIICDAGNNLFLTGNFNGVKDFDTGIGTYNLTSAGNSDIFFSQFDLNGNFVWAKKIGGSGYDEVKSMHIDPIGNIYSTGSFFGTVDFNPDGGINNLVSTGNKDIYVNKLKQNVLSQEMLNSLEAESEIFLYPNPNTGTFTINNLEIKSLIKIYNLSGQFICEKTAEYNNQKIDVNDLSNGIYFVEFIKDNKTYRKKLVKIN